MFTPCHFFDLATRPAIASALKRQTDVGHLRQLARGLYDERTWSNVSTQVICLLLMRPFRWTGLLDDDAQEDTRSAALVLSLARTAAAISSTPK